MLQKNVPIFKALHFKTNFLIFPVNNFIFWLENKKARAKRKGVL